jgi:hypothetical protein
MQGCETAVISAVQHKNLIMYLLAVKSLTRQVDVGNIYILNDGTLTRKDIEILNKHIPGFILLEGKDFKIQYCPSDVSWQRLKAVSELIKNHYIIQLDSDTLTLGPITEVVDCIKGNRGFIIGTWDNQDLETMEERCETAKNYNKRGSKDHVQVVAEANFDKLSEFKSLKYIRGCSGFMGFPKGSFSKSFIERISGEIRAAIGEKWNEWGSEQAMGNIIVANIPNSKVLPHPKYCAVDKMKPLEAVFIHFIGTYRFSKGIYSRLARNIIRYLLNP